MKMKKKLTFLWMMLLCLAILPVSKASALTNIAGNVTTNQAWGPTGTPGFQDTEFLLQGSVFVENGAELTIQPGVTIYGETSTIGALIVSRGAKIHAVGTPAQPIVFTSQNVLLGGTPDRGDWGGLIISGYAPINRPGGEAAGEGSTGLYGGGDPYDNSGEIQYVHIEYAGHLFTPENELNGIAFQGVGNGTTVDHVQVHMNKDDCIEMFGGTVNMKYMIGSWCRDDGMDWTEGWNGMAQYVLVTQRGDEADNGQESDNYEFGFENLPRSHPFIYNLTYVGDPSTTYGIESTSGMRLRRGTAAEERNVIITGFKSTGIRVDDASTLAQGNAGALAVNNGIVWGNNGGGAQFNANAQTLVNNFWTNLQVIDHELCNPFDYVKPNAAPASGSPAIDGTVPAAIPPTGLSTREYIGDTTNGLAGGTPIGNEDGICDIGENCIDYGTFFDITNFIGAVSENNNDWTYGWSNLGQKQLVDDLNYDNQVDIVDLVRVNRIALNLDPAQACTDADLSGSTDISDVVMGLRMSIGVDPTRTCCQE